jgi:hypothetical protein
VAATGIGAVENPGKDVDCSPFAATQQRRAAGGVAAR